MKILIFAPNYLPATRYGGPVRSTHGLARALVQLGHQVTVLTTNVDGPGLLDVPLDRAVDLDGVKVHYCAIQAPKRLYYSPQIARLADQLIPEMDVVHINGMFLWPGSRIAHAAQKMGKPVVISPRGMLMPEMVSGKSRWVKKAWIALRERTALKGARAIHVTSEIEAEGLRRMGLDLAPVTVIPNGVDGPEQTPSQAEMDAIWGNVSQGRRVAFLARLDWTKGLDHTIEAVRCHPEAFLLIAGHDQIGMRAQLESRLMREDGSICGKFIGPLEGTAKWAFLAGADVLLAPSVSESFGMSVAEALSVGTPVITTPAVGAKNLIQATGCGVIVDRNPEALTASLANLLDSIPEWDAQRGTVIETMAMDYGWLGVAITMVSTYSSTSSAIRSGARA